MNKGIYLPEGIYINNQNLYFMEAFMTEAFYGHLGISDRNFILYFSTEKDLLDSILYLESNHYHKKNENHYLAPMAINVYLEIKKI